MPRYDYHCSSCGHTQEEVRTISKRDDYSFCPKCGFDLTRQMVYPLSRDWFRPHWNDGFDLKPIYVESKSHYKRLCKDYKVQARALL